MFTELYLLGTALKKSALVQSSKNTITINHTSKLKSISKYQLLTLPLYTFENHDFWYFTLKQVKHNLRTLCRDSRIRS